MLPSAHEIEIANKLHERSRLSTTEFHQFLGGSMVYYFVDDEQKFTTCVVMAGNWLRAGATKRVTHRGWKPDAYNEQTGRDIAFARALLSKPVLFPVESIPAASSWTYTEYDVRLGTEIVGLL